jgi:hypothetical protein
MLSQVRQAILIIADNSTDIFTGSATTTELDKLSDNVFQSHSETPRFPTYFVTMRPQNDALLNS